MNGNAFPWQLLRVYLCTLGCTDINQGKTSITHKSLISVCTAAVDPYISSPDPLEQLILLFLIWTLEGSGEGTVPSCALQADYG